MSNLSERVTVDEANGGSNDPRSDRFPSGRLGTEDPLGNDQYGPTHENPVTDVTDANQTGATPDPQMDVQTCNEGQQTPKQQVTLDQIERDCADTQTEIAVNKKGREEHTDGTLLGKKGEFTQGQKEEGINCPPEARQLYFKIPSTPTTTSIGPENKMGFTKGVTETKTRGYSANSPQPQQEKGSDWKVYSKGKGCRKKWTPTNSQQISSNPDSKDLDPQSTARCLKQSTSTSNNNLLHEVINQWEMEKDLGMTCDGEEPNIIGKIKSMELRDREEEHCWETIILHHEYPVLQHQRAGERGEVVCN